MPAFTPPREKEAIDPRLFVAIAIAVLLHGGLLVTGSFRRTYDAYVHLFFADHYQRDWFSTWDARWYTGFPTISYPPGTHQLLALFGKVLGTGNAFVLVQLAMSVLLVVGVYRFAVVWQGERAAGWAALAAATSSSLAEVIHVFGQLPTTAALAFLLNAQPSIRAWILEGRRRDLATALALLGATTAVHHVTTLFGSVFFTGPMVAASLLAAVSTPLDHEVEGHAHDASTRTLIGLSARRIVRVSAAFRRTVVLGFATISLLILVILPYWLWSSSDPISQVPIPHGSRDNFLEERNTGLVFWVVPWSSTLLLLPFAVMKGLRGKAWPLAASVSLLALLGTGGTTPIPRMLLGGAFDILTLDRFTIWATIAVLPLAGAVIEGLVVGSKDSLVVRAAGRRAPKVILATLATIGLTSTLFAASLTNFRPTQPAFIDPAPIVAFMDKDEHFRWRYLMLGFGDQMANVSAQSTALTVDGNYHSARRLPELTSHSVERLEGAKYRGVPGLGSLQEFIGSPARYNLKFVFSNDAFYDPMLWASGWQRIGSLDNDIVVWERPDVPPLLAHEERPQIPSWQRLMWGIFPMATIAAACVALVSLRRRLPDAPPARHFSRLDRFWLRRADALSSAPLDRSKVLYRPNLRALPLAKYDVAVTRLVAVGLAGLVLLGVVSVVRTPPPGPEDAVTSYYDHLDFQRFDAAWAELDPATRPTFEDYITTISGTDGLVAGYAKLQSIDVLDVDAAENDATVTVGLVYLTSVQSFTREVTHSVRRTVEGWKLAPVDSVIAPAGTTELTRSQQTTYQQSSPTAITTRLPATADRPRLQLGPTRVLTIDNQWYVLGEVTNIDDRPAYISLDITARDVDGDEMTTVSPSAVAGHTARPGETVPFLAPVVRVVPAAAPGEELPAADFDPDDEISPIVEFAPTSIDVSARAVTATRGLERPLQLEDTVLTTGEGLDLSGNIVNLGTDSITIPHVLVSVFDQSGQLRWVHDYWAPAAVVVSGRGVFDVDVTIPSGIQERPDVTLELFADEVTGSSRLPIVATSPEGLAAAIHVTGFRRTEIE